MRIREPALKSRASCYMADPTSEESENHVKDEVTKQKKKKKTNVFYRLLFSII